MLKSKMLKYWHHNLQTPQTNLLTLLKCQPYQRKHGMQKSLWTEPSPLWLLKPTNWKIFFTWTLYQILKKRASYFKKKKVDIKKAVKKKNTLICNQINQKAAHNKKIEKEKELSIFQTGVNNTSAACWPKTFDKDALISAVTDIAIAGSATDERRRIQIINTCKTLDDLVEKLKGLGYNMKPSSVYLELIPRRKDSIEGQRHEKVCFTSFIF